MPEVQGSPVSGEDAQATEAATGLAVLEPAEPGPELVPDLAQEPSVEAAPTQVRAEPAPLPELLPGEAEEEIRRAILAVQDAFGSRIERILGSGGGLLVVLDRVDQAADQVAAAIPGRIPVALIDPRTLGGLRRLGAASPVAAAQTLFEAQAADAVPAEPRLLTQARDKLRGAEVLIQQSCPGPALDLLLGALLAAAAVRAGETTAPAPQQAGVWLYGEALPKGRLTPDQAGLIMRGLALAQGADAVPEPLVRALAAEVAQFVEAGTDA
jgi:hypothetical protein